MKYVTRFSPRGPVLCLITEREGGPFACEFPRAPAEDRERVSETAQYILWKAIAAQAPGVFAEALTLGWVPESVSKNVPQERSKSDG